MPRLDLSLYEEFPAESLKDRRFYNIGAGLFFHPYWQNIDYSTAHYTGIQGQEFINYDLMALGPLPILSDSAEVVYSSHTIEHVSNAAVMNMLKESYRILKTGGGIRLTTTDALLEYRAYKQGNSMWFHWLKDWYAEKISSEPLTSVHGRVFLDHFATQLCGLRTEGCVENPFSDDEIDEIFAKLPMEEAFDYFTKKCAYDQDFPGWHINWWTHEKAIKFLKEAGFSDVYVSAYGQSLFPVLSETMVFDNKHPYMSMYVEAVK